MLRWELPNQDHSILASAANELRTDKYTSFNSDKLKVAAEGLQQIGMAFAVANVIVFGGATLIFGFAVSKLEAGNRSSCKTMIQNKSASRGMTHKKAAVQNMRMIQSRPIAQNNAVVHNRTNSSESSQT